MFNANQIQNLSYTERSVVPSEGRPAALAVAAPQAVQP
jgi:hypothetical protein